MKRFFCDKCGKCCEKLPALVIDPGLDDGTGKCKFYDSQTNLCTIYDQRPDICNVDKMYSAFASLMSYEEYIDMNYYFCTKLKFIRQVKEEFIFGSYKDMIMNDYI